MQFSASLEVSREPALPPGFTELYLEHYDFLWRCALRMGAPAAEIEDIVQECFIIALRRFGEFDPRGRGRPGTWLFGILRNVLRNHARATRRRAARLDLLSNDSEESPRCRAEAGLAGRLLEEFLLTLDDDKRAAFVLGEIEGMTGPELAGALEINLNTANSRLRAARQAFNRHFEESERRRIARTQLERSATVRAPEAACRRGLPVLVAAAGSGIGLAPGLGVLGSKLIAGLIFAVASAGAVAIVAGGRPSEAPAHAVESEQEGDLAQPRASAPTRVLPSNDELSEAPREPELAVAPSSPTRSQQPKRPTALERIADARAALLANNPARALELIEGRRFSSNLEGRRIALEVAALCQLDRRARARQRAQAWREANPEDPTAAALVDVCWSERSD
jgi:RNA polymerase sigma factor (sigma-70 family)